jgi:hypothetical protein
MPRGPRGEKRPADVISAAIMLRESLRARSRTPRPRKTPTQPPNGFSKKFDNHCHALAVRDMIRHSCARRRYSSALLRVTNRHPLVRYATNATGDAAFQKFKIYNGFGPEFQTEALPTGRGIFALEG